MRLLILISLLFTIATAIVINGGGRGYSGGRFGSSSSSEERGRGGRGGRRGPGRGRGGCDNGWLRFQRPNGVIWCIYIASPGVRDGRLSQQQAQTACAGMGATLTGFQNNNERMTVANEAYRKMTSMGVQVAGLWLGATNLPGCRSPSCGPYNTFQWTDGQTTGIEGLKWGVNEPDNNNWPGPSACIQQFIISPNYVAGPNDYAAWKTHFVNGDLDKYQCTAPAYPLTRFYACGKVGGRR
uniref:C-type lectin domain-containing protein n=1 Tax=Caenorhabditis tropicalis TaxID=1561998 RepID=A0A1I7UU65_9PELO